MQVLRVVLRLFLILAIPVATALFTYVVLQRTFLSPANPADNSPILYELAPSLNSKQISKQLEERGLIKKWWVFDMISRLRRSDTKIKPGEYELNRSMTPLEILKKLVAGKTFQRRVTVTEGSSIWDIGPALEAAGILSSAEFELAVADTTLTKNAGLLASSFEGYLYPETYFFSRPVTAKTVIWRMLEEGERHWRDFFTERADELKMSRHEILTLASIIEKESGTKEELPTIASVFHNRLRQGMKLQSDPTVIYAIPDFDGNLTRTHLQIDSPYNTYVHFGLPPGPICNPGENAIKAALYPADTQFLYFVATQGGQHAFATTLEEHNNFVKLYQLGRQP